MRRAIFSLLLLLAPLAPAFAQVSVNIGVSLGGYPTLQRIPNYPVYYAPGLQSNYFFYDGLYWVYEQDNWYASSWYNGPWRAVDNFEVPVYLLRVPVRYYRHQPAYFRGWQADAPPRWGDHWGNAWSQRRPGWDRWNRGSAPAPAPLPAYQRQYSGSKYPQASQQGAIETRNYRYQPTDAVAQQHFKVRHEQARPASGIQQSPPDQPHRGERPSPPPREQQQERRGHSDDSRDQGRGKGRDKD